MGNTDNLRNSGISIVGQIPWGTHFCYFYYSVEELLKLLLDFIIEGLISNEICIWITSNEINIEDAYDIIVNELNGRSSKVNLKEQLKIIDYDEFFLENQAISDKNPITFLDKILADGLEHKYNGIRLTGDTNWLRKEDFEDFMCYELKIDDAKSKWDMMMLCTYPINKFIKADILSIANTHDFSLFDRNDGLKIIKRSEREDIEQEKREIQLQMQNLQRINNIGVLTSSIAHDFNNLLSIIKSYADMARMEIESDDQINSYLNEISLSIKSSAKLIHRLLVYSKEDSRQMDLKIININDIIKELLEMMNYFIAEDIIILTKLDSNLPNIQGDVGKIEQILLNLMINARDALPDGGKIIIKTLLLKKEDLDYNLKDRGESENYIQIYIEDNGIGMDKHTLDNIFQPFFTTKDEGKGTGLGLTIVKTFTEDHNGWINVESHEGQGSIFRVFLPTNLES
ncbi:MAG: putative Histidine kinase [Promethearchaeota archaeon]|nr:MAG: putative Histidine kinase [Candidatus Lokiarchaeota archaeon]